MSKLSMDDMKRLNNRLWYERKFQLEFFNWHVCLDFLLGMCLGCLKWQRGMCLYEQAFS